MMFIRLLLCAVLWVPTVLPRTMLTAGGKERIIGNISGKVEIILQTMSFTAEQRKAMLEVEYRNMMSLGLDKTEPALVQKIEAHLGLARAQKDRLRALAETQKEHGALQDSFIEYAKRIIKDATPYSNAVGVPGLPDISQQREVSMIERAHAAALHEELSKAYENIVKVHKKIRTGLQKNNTLKALLQSFTVHMKRKYQARGKGIEEEVSFRTFDILADASPDDTRMIGDVVGDFLPKYNRYVPVNHQIKENDVAISYIGWAEVILESRRAESHIMLLLSFAMEQVKRNIKDDAVFIQQKEMLVEKTAEAVDALRETKAEFVETKASQPLYIAIQCGSHVESLINTAGGRDKLLPAQREAAKRFTTFANDINQLITDYEIVARRQADNQAARRTTQERATLPAEHQAVLRPVNEPTSDPLAAMLSSELERNRMKDEERPKQSNSKWMKWVPIAVTALILIGWQVLGAVAKNKSEEAKEKDNELKGFWRLFDGIGTPTGLVGSGIQGLRKRFLKQVEDETTDAEDTATGDSAAEKPAKKKQTLADLSIETAVVQSGVGLEPKPKPKTTEAGTDSMPPAEPAKPEDDTGDVPPPPAPEPAPNAAEEPAADVPVVEPAETAAGAEDDMSPEVPIPPTATSV